MASEFFLRPKIQTDPTGNTVRSLLMKIQVSYDRAAQVSTDLLVIILDSETRVHDLGGSPVEDTVRRIAQDLEGKRLKTDYFTSLDSRGPARHLAVYSTALSTSYNTW